VVIGGGDVLCGDGGGGQFIVGIGKFMFCLEEVEAVYVG